VNDYRQNDPVSVRPAFQEFAVDRGGAFDGVTIEQIRRIKNCSRKNSPSLSRRMIGLKPTATPTEASAWQPSYRCAD
jgi:hypothetical protein